MKLRNIILALKEQGPFKRAFKNFFITGNAWGMFYKKSHTKLDGTPKVTYNSVESARKAAEAMMRKRPEFRFSAYKCIFCDGFHIGKNKK